MTAMMSKAKSADALVKELPPPLRTLVRKLRAFVKKRAGGLEEQIKWGSLCWAGNGIVCYLHAHTAHVDFGFFKGARLEDPEKVLEGKGKFLRHVKVRKPSDIRERELAKLLKQALALDA